VVEHTVSVPTPPSIFRLGFSPIRDPLNAKEKREARCDCDRQSNGCICDRVDPSDAAQKDRGQQTKNSEDFHENVLVQ
jgi:hypothetical protein